MGDGTTVGNPGDERHFLPIHALLVLNSLKHLHKASIHDLTEDICIEEIIVKNIIDSLTEAGLVEAAGTGKGRY